MYEKNENKQSNEISNTRPVTISNAIQNFFEKISLWQVNNKHTEYKQQFGFKANSSCRHAVFAVAQAANFAKQNSNRLYTK